MPRLASPQIHPAPHPSVSVPPTPGGTTHCQQKICPPGGSGAQHPQIPVPPFLTTPEGRVWGDVEHLAKVPHCDEHLVSFVSRHRLHN